MAETGTKPSGPASFHYAWVFVCGASTNGLIGTHLIAACHDHRIAEVHSAQLLDTDRVAVKIQIMWLPASAGRMGECANELS